MQVFDMHCDTLTYCKQKGWSLDNGKNHLHLSDALDFDSYIQLYAIFIDDALRGKRAQDYFSIHHTFYRRQLEEAGEALYDVNSPEGLRTASSRRGMSSILAVEGGSVLGGDLEQVEYLQNAGVRSLTLTWNSNNELAGGVKDDGHLTDFGREAIAALEKAGIAVDVSHLNDDSFWEVAEAAEKPFIATHSNSRSICGHPRNLTDEMFQEIVRRGGVVGLNFANIFIAPGGEGATLERMARHVIHFLELGGEDTVALGSDYDGADIDDCIDAPHKLYDLRDTLLKAGVTQEQCQKLFFGNAYRYFDRLISGVL